MGINGFQLILLFLEINRLEMNRAMKEVILHLASFPSDKVLIERERQREGELSQNKGVCVLVHCHIGLFTQSALTDLGQRQMLTLNPDSNLSRRLECVCIFAGTKVVVSVCGGWGVPVCCFWPMLYTWTPVEEPEFIVLPPHSSVITWQPTRLSSRAWPIYWGEAGWMCVCADVS